MKSLNSPFAPFWLPLAAFAFSLAAIGLLAAQAAPPDVPFAGTYEGQGMKLVLEPFNGGYFGTIQSAASLCKLTASANGGTLEGSFGVNGRSFSFTAVFDGKTLVLTTGQTTYRLQPQAAPAETPAPNPAPSPSDLPAPIAPAPGGGKYTVTPNTNALLLIPELKNAPAPAWVKPGVRISIHGMDATIALTRQCLVPSPNGGWINKRTGEHCNFDANSGGGGQGITQVDVVAVHDDCVVLQSAMYIILGIPGNLQLATCSGVTTTPSASGFWINPDVLRKQPELNGEGISTYKTPYTAAGKKFNALWTSTFTDDSSTTYVYDLDSGLILHTGMCATAVSQPIIVNGIAQNVGGQTNLSQSTLLGTRQIKVPWTQGKLPRVLDGVKKLVYDGTQSVVLPDGATAPVMGRIHNVFTITGRGNDFIQEHCDGSLSIGGAQGMPYSADYVSGPTQLTPSAIDPADLANLHQGQEIDRDPITSIVTTVSFIGRDRRGHDVVVITQAVPGPNLHHCDVIYDRTSGLLIGTILHNLVPGTVNELWLTSKE